ncbi:AIPR family protein [Mesorhizobium sp.]|uniref:AIPR family protein n=1 Tax=Mesorhizobium sp. TaxID=1871066 RepID=UPI00257AD13B|nr:AIPR family protein [Mesorhizobium sp.]
MAESADANDVHLTGTEFGLDGVAILIQGEVVKTRFEAQEKLETIKNPSIEFVFFQSKTSPSYDYGDISKFFDAINSFFEGDLGGESAQLSDLTEAMHAIYEGVVGKRNPSLKAFYIATGNYEEPRRIEGLKSSFIRQMSEKNMFDPDSLDVGIVGALQLQQWYRAATTSVEAEIEFTKAVVMPKNKNVDEAYVGYLEAKQLVKLFTIVDDKGDVIGLNKSVFIDNIRDYDQKSKINQEIKASVLTSGGDDFAFRNNGVTVVSKSIDRTGDRFHLEDYQIVNGCQTSNIIYELIFGDSKSAAESLELIDHIAVPFRLIGSKNDEFVASIIIGTNRQNPVKEEQFWALRPFLKSLEEYARSVDSEEVIYLERRENQYRGQQVERVRIIQPSSMMKALAAAIFFQPNRAARDYRGIMAEYDSKIFKDDHDVRIYHACCYLYYRIEFLWRNQRIDNKFKTFRFYIICAVGLIVTRGRDVFSMKKSEVEKTAQNLIGLSKDEEALKAVVFRSSAILEDKLKQFGSQSQERVRDAIRSETISNEFREILLTQDIPEVKKYAF